jgi:hypothetical protein
VQHENETPETIAGARGDGRCAGGSATQVSCNDDAVEGNGNSQLDVPLTGGQVVTVSLNQLTQSAGGTGTLTITLSQ